MKYNVLSKFKGYLVSELGLSAKTALTYYHAMAWLINDQHILNCQNLNVDMVIEKLRTLKYKNTFSKHKSAFLKFCDFINLDLSYDNKITIEGLSKTKKKKRRKLTTVYLNNINNNIKVIKDKKLKLSYITMLSTGLRVSELSQIKKEDILIFENCLILYFIGKGGRKESIRINKNINIRLYHGLIELINTTKQDKKVFYSKSHLQKNAMKRDFKCHDLRRAFAKIKYKECRNLLKVNQLLRHRSIRTTKIYLNSRIIIYSTVKTHFFGI